MRAAALVAVLALVVSAGLTFAAPGKPDFSARLYADGVAWGTKVTNLIRNPDYDTLDKLYVITNSNNPDPQLPVGEAAPYEDDYDGGRWWTFTVEWTPEGLAHHGTVPILMSDDDIFLHEGLGHLTITEGSPPGGPPEFFHCPLLPVKE
jgi:hypothetical protein